ncbi:hypothetical protein [Mucilaginibacter myungsuensis]|uniref:Uncharacterized protein n=1 Tax=Mucilaginibacter myungsuensis TaxID=649104 RepID=A0A929PVQ1_9SPHI|nr:hypothetical protein [Mucilaginibacter myungsuensis]MBE9660337.1 hypothetical protein [Mucilaginibacter myungsuensis]MDN3600379.1 hypothetical protein [Mucilaginibacter myungsuensis]
MRPGDKVICVNATIDPDKAEEIRKDFEIWVTKDTQYTVRELLDNNGIVMGVLLDEIHNFPKYFKLIDRFQEPAFAHWRFRKLNYATSEAAEEQVEELVGVGRSDEKQQEGF